MILERHLSNNLIDFDTPAPHHNYANDFVVGSKDHKFSARDVFDMRMLLPF